MPCRLMNYPEERKCCVPEQKGTADLQLCPELFYPMVRLAAEASVAALLLADPQVVLPLADRLAE